MATILLVEDSVSLRALLERTLVDGGHQVVTAPDGREAISILSRMNVDAIVTDIYMPDTDGLELIGAIAKMGRRPPVIAMSSARGARDMLRPARVLGAKVTLQKPFPPAELLRCANALVKSPEMRGRSA